VNILRRQWNDLAARRRLLTILSGTLLVLGLGFGRVGGMDEFGVPVLVIAAIIAGSDIAMRAISSLRRRQVTIELLVTIAATGAIIIGEFWEAAAVTFLFILGAWLEARTMGRTRQELGRLLDLAPVSATVVQDGELIDVDPGDVEDGATVLVRPGARVPVDGIVQSGRATVDESAITGEPIPVEKGESDAVFAGTIGQDGLIYVTATGVGADTTLARIIHRVEEAQESKAHSQRVIERFASWYTPSIIGLAVVAWGISGNVKLALTLLVIGCPGALVIATPVAIVAGIGRAARNGILIKGGEYLETVGSVTALALDKTGTLTRGEPVVTDVLARQPALVAAGNSSTATTMTENDLLWWAGVAEMGSTHPLARSITAAAQDRTGAAIPSPETGETIPGKGVWAEWNGRAVTVGTPELLDERGIAVEPQAYADLTLLRDEGKTAMMVAIDDEFAGMVAVADTHRENTTELIPALKRAGVNRVAMLTGDNQRTAQAIGGAIGIQEIHAGLLPDDKLNWIRQAQAEGEIVAMVGDGINDTPALAASNVGIAMGAAGSDVALETADVALMADDLSKIPEALRLSRMTLQIIRQNLGIAMVTVAALLIGVLLGEVNMAGGMLVHEISILVVILNGMRLLRA
jgi:Zn2+/Cd2+-exporting ATPase